MAPWQSQTGPPRPRAGHVPRRALGPAYYFRPPRGTGKAASVCLRGRPPRALDARPCWPRRLAGPGAGAGTAGAASAWDTQQLRSLHDPVHLRSREAASSPSLRESQRARPRAAVWTSALRGGRTDDLRGGSRRPQAPTVAGSEMPNLNFSDTVPSKSPGSKAPAGTRPGHPGRGHRPEADTRPRPSPSVSGEATLLPASTPSPQLSVPPGTPSHSFPGPSPP